MLWLKADNHRLLRACLLGSKRKLPPPVCQALQFVTCALENPLAELVALENPWAELVTVL